MKNRLIVLSGEAGAGKDAVAKVLVDDHGWTLYSLAAPLKRFAKDMFGFTDEQLYGPSSARNAPDPRWERRCPERANHAGFTLMPCETCGGTGKLNDNSPRRVLQLLGEEYLRQMIHVDALTIRARPELEALLADDRVKGIVINDARNDNDRNNLHSWLEAARVDVRSARTKQANKPLWRQHASENRQPTDDQLEHVVQNDEDWPFPSLKARVDQMLKSLYG